MTATGPTRTLPAPGAGEVDLGRWARLVAARWYVLVAGMVLGVLLASLSGVAGRKNFTAQTLIFVAQPFRENAPMPYALSVYPEAPGVLAREEAVLERAARAAGLRAVDVRGGVSVQPIAQPIPLPGQRVTASTLVEIVVQGPWRRSVAPASRSVAEQIVALLNRSNDAKAGVLKQLLDGELRERAMLARQDGQTRAADQRIAESRLPVLQKTLIRSGLATRSAQLETRMGQLGDAIGKNRILLAQNRLAERSAIVTLPVARPATPTSTAARYAVAAAVGLLIAVLVVVTLAGLARVPAAGPVEPAPV